MNKTKVCKTCGEEFPLTDEYFSKRKGCKDGFGNQCKICVSKQKARYYEENKEDRIKIAKIWNLNNKEKIKEARRDYHREYSKKWRDDNKTHIAEYIENNKEKYRDLSRAAEQRRNALKRNLPATLTLSEWEFIKESFGFKCCYCGEELPLAQEHYLAVANQGGYELGNIVPACQSCNSSKGAKLINDWYPTHKSYSPDRESKILTFIEETKEMNLINNLNVA